MLQGGAEASKQMRPLLAALEVLGDVEEFVPRLGALRQRIPGLYPFPVDAFCGGTLLELKVALFRDLSFYFNALW